MPAATRRPRALFTSQQTEAFAIALTDALDRSTTSQSLLADRLGVTQSLLSKWKSGSVNPPVGKVLEMERALDLPSGSLARHLGFGPPVSERRDCCSVVQAIHRDDRLGRSERDLLISLYRHLVGDSGIGEPAEPIPAARG